MDIELEANERIDDLEFKNLKIIQNKDGFCFGIDSVLLSDFAKNIKKDSMVLDLGTGTGIIPILLCGKTKLKKVTGIELQEEVAKMAKKSIKLNNLEDKFNVIKGFLNLTISSSCWIDLLNTINAQPEFGKKEITETSPLVMIEYSSPNTNKPLHLGHVRNNLLGYSLAEIMKANGYKVVKTNIVNDRGIHICKSMLAWQKWGEGVTPE